MQPQNTSKLHHLFFLGISVFVHNKIGRYFLCTGNKKAYLLFFNNFSEQILFKLSNLFLFCKNNINFYKYTIIILIITDQIYDTRCAEAGRWALLPINRGPNVLYFMRYQMLPFSRLKENFPNIRILTPKLGSTHVTAE